MGQVNYENIQPLIAFTGAGISAESGVPTFRGEGGIWEQHRSQDLATPEAFEKDPRLVWRFYLWRRNIVGACTPNAAHHLLAEMEQQLDSFTIITQNVDGLHEAAGSRNILSLHGSLWRLRCTKCKARWEQREVSLEDSLPSCPKCAGLARPDVVWFGETLQPQILQEAQRASSTCRTMLVIGTSAVVQPAAQLPMIAKRNGAEIIEMNLEPTPLTRYADLSLLGPATISLEKWWGGVGDRGQDLLHMQ